MRDDGGQRRGTLYRYRFGTAEFDESRFELRVGGEPVTIQRRPLEVLAVLLRHAGEVVTKEELLAIVWAGVNTVDNVVANALSKLRTALGLIMRRGSSIRHGLATVLRDHQSG